jgi:hypothetical protein
MNAHLREKLWSLVEDLVASGASPTEVVQEIREGWAESLRDKISRDDRSFDKLLKAK